MYRLLFVLDIGFDRGGPSVHILQDIIRAGLNEGHTIEVILKDTGGFMAVMPNEFNNATNFQYYAIKADDEKKNGLIARYINEVKYAKACSKIFLNNGHYDAVFLQSNTAAFFYIRNLKKLGCRIVFNVQDIFPYNLKLSKQLPLERITFPVFRKLQNMAYQRSDTIITISDDMKETLVKDGVDSSKIKVVFNWSYADSPISLEDINIDNFFDLHINHNKINLVYAGNIGKMQNVELIARAAQGLQDENDVHFYIIGDGANKKRIESMVEGLNNVTLLPMQPSKFAESLYAQADVNIIPLVPGGIKTALPSKTATILRVNKPILFCVDSGSIIEQRFKNDVDTYFVDCTNEKELIDTIKELSMRSKETVQFPKDYKFMSVENAKDYIRIMITGEK